jgi:hypothetical protein
MEWILSCRDGRIRRGTALHVARTGPDGMEKGHGQSSPDFTNRHAPRPHRARSARAATMPRHDHFVATAAIDQP